MLHTVRSSVPFSADQLKLDSAQEVERISSAIRDHVFKQLRRKGVVVGLSGGIDSSVVAALSVHALGADRVFGLFMPERDSTDDSLKFGQLVATSLGIKTAVEDITPILEGAGCYRRRDECIKSMIPEYQTGYKSKIVVHTILGSARYPVYSVVIESPEGVQAKAMLNADACLGIVAATNFKQRARKMMEYYYADRLQYAVAGTPNRLEHDQGFFVKNGDGAADLKPIAHLYKSQVYQLAEYLNVPEEVRRRVPTTDTYSLQQTQEEFYFAIPYHKFDLCLYGKNHGLPASEVASAAGMTSEQVEAVYRDIEMTRRATRHLHSKPFLVDPVEEVP